LVNNAVPSQALPHEPQAVALRERGQDGRLGGGVGAEVERPGLDAQPALGREIGGRLLGELHPWRGDEPVGQAAERSGQREPEERGGQDHGGETGQGEELEDQQEALVVVALVLAPEQADDGQERQRGHAPERDGGQREAQGFEPEGQPKPEGEGQEEQVQQIGAVLVGQAHERQHGHNGQGELPEDVVGNALWLMQPGIEGAEGLPVVPIAGGHGHEPEENGGEHHGGGQQGPGQAHPEARLGGLLVELAPVGVVIRRLAESFVAEDLLEIVAPGGALGEHLGHEGVVLQEPFVGGLLVFVGQSGEKVEVVVLGHALEQAQGAHGHDEGPAGGLVEAAGGQGHRLGQGNARRTQCQHVLQPRPGKQNGAGNGRQGQEKPDDHEQRGLAQSVERAIDDGLEGEIQELVQQQVGQIDEQANGGIGHPPGAEGAELPPAQAQSGLEQGAAVKRLGGERELGQLVAQDLDGLVEVDALPGAEVVGGGHGAQQVGGQGAEGAVEAEAVGQLLGPEVVGAGGGTLPLGEHLEVFAGAGLHQPGRLADVEVNRPGLEELVEVQGGGVSEQGLVGGDPGQGGR